MCMCSCAFVDMTEDFSFCVGYRAQCFAGPPEEPPAAGTRKRKVYADYGVGARL